MADPPPEPIVRLITEAARTGNPANLDQAASLAKNAYPGSAAEIDALVADLRAPTPSAAAELIVPDIVDLRRQMEGCARGLGRELLNRLHDSQQRLDHSRETLRRCLVHKIDNYRRGLAHALATLQARSPLRELLLRRNRFGDLHRRFIELQARTLENSRHRFERIKGILRVLGPDATLRRGYSITRNERGELIRTVAAVRAKMKIQTRVSDGEFESTTSG